MATQIDGPYRAPDASGGPSALDGLKDFTRLYELEQSVERLRKSQAERDRERTAWGRQVLELDIGGGTRINLSVDGHWGPDELERLISFLAFQKGMLMEAAKGENKEFPF